MGFQPYSQQRAPEANLEDSEGAAPDQNPHDIERPRTPSWFAQPHQTMTPDDAAERYRAMRSELLRSPEAPKSSRPSLLDLEIKRSFGLEAGDKARSRNHQRVPLAPPRKMAAAAPVEEPGQDHPSDDRRPRRMHRKAKAAPSPTPRRLPLRYVAAGLASVLAGGLLGYAATHYKAISAKADEIAGLMRPQAEEPVAAKDAVTVLAKKTIATATLNVADVSGQLNSMIPLMLHAEPAELGHELVLKLSGLPESAYLTAGAKAADNAWQLAAADAAGVKLVVPQTSQPRFEVAVAAFEAKTGELAAPIKEMTVAIDDPGLKIAPAAALPENVVIKTGEQSEELVAAAVPLPREQQVASVEPPGEAKNLLAKGDILLKSGDLGMARQFYERAFAQGSVEAAIGAGKTYDPAVYTELKVHGLKPDPTRAMEWYVRASAGGSPDAAAAIEALKQAAP